MIGDGKQWYVIVRVLLREECSSNDKDKDKDGFSGIGGSLLDGL